MFVALIEWVAGFYSYWFMNILTSYIFSGSISFKKGGKRTHLNISLIKTFARCVKVF